MLVIRSLKFRSAPFVVWQRKRKRERERERETKEEA